MIELPEDAMISFRSDCRAKLVPKEREEQGWDQDDPEAAHAAKQIGAPGPFALLQCSDHASANEETDQNKEDHHGLMAEPRHEVECLGNHSGRDYLGKRNKEKSPKMLHNDKERSQSTQAIKMNKAVVHFGGAGGEAARLKAEDF